MEHSGRLACFNFLVLGCLAAFVLPLAAGFPVMVLFLLAAVLGTFLAERALYHLWIPRLRAAAVRLLRFWPAIRLLVWGFAGLLLGAGIQIAWLMAGGPGLTGPELRPGLQVEGQLVRDIQLRQAGERIWLSLQLQDCRFTDLQGRSCRVPGAREIRFTLPAAADQDWPERLLFAGDRLRLVIQDDGRTGRLIEVWPAGGLAGGRSRLLRQFMRSCLSLGDGAGQLVLALLLGRQDFLPSADRDLFGKTGCVHLVALSGMHISLVLGLAFGLFRCLAGPRGGTVLGLVTVLALVWLLGPFPSVIRALLMCLWVELAALAGFRIENREALGLGTLTLLLIDPAMLFSLGYQLSCITLYGLCFLQELLDRRLKPLLRPLFAGLLCPGLAAQAAALPVLLVRQLPWYPQGLLAGILLEPLCLLLMGAGFLWMVLGSTGALACLAPLDQVVLGPAIRLLYGLIVAVGRFFIWFP